MKSEKDLTRMDYKKKLIRSIGWEIKAGRKETYSQNKWTHHTSAMAIWAYGVYTNLLNNKEANGIYRQILDFSKTIDQEVK